VKATALLVPGLLGYSILSCGRARDLVFAFCSADGVWQKVAVLVGMLCRDCDRSGNVIAMIESDLRLTVKHEYGA